ncbi:AraC family transcriptional regulator [Neptunomonas sp. XY-337]|uniref:AraC family transcriptional regulator n=1 Tax=Neptunomonas sp. XY-337 TaxID=2561897 RepID=UPI0010AAD42A|nr:AraC family transcriptional regulator [Neptunomonas sp. XY-337]
MKPSTSHQYRQRLHKVLDYIYAHQQATLDVNTLADVAAMSPYHFHRIYRQMSGENINATIRRIRLQYAAAELIRTEKPLPQIANQACYTSLEAFSRAFSKQYGIAPSVYREGKQRATNDIKPLRSELPPIKDINHMFEVEISQFPGLELIGYEHKGDYMGIGQSFEKLFIYAGSKGLLNQSTRSFGIYYHDPGSVESDELRSHACITSNSPTDTDNDAPTPLTLPAGTCVNLLFKGSYAELEKPYAWLFGNWFPQSGYEPGDFPCFEEYLNDPKTTPPDELLTRIYCLLR